MSPSLLTSCDDLGDAPLHQHAGCAACVLITSIMTAARIASSCLISTMFLKHL